TARITDLLLPRFRFYKVAWDFASCVPKVDLESKRILAGLTVEDPLQRGIGDKSAVPVILALDLRSWKPWRPRAARHHMCGGEITTVIIEIDKIACAHINRADAQMRFPGINAVKIHQLSKSRSQR